MKRIVLVACAVLGVSLGFGHKASASWGQLGYSGYQPWWNIFAKRYKCLTPEEERLQKFWHDYYDALKHYYAALDHIDWVAYYKNHGYAINGGCCGPYGGGRINYAPVFVSPTMQWAIPSSCMSGPPTGGGCGPMMGGCPPMMGGGGPMMGGPGPMMGGPGPMMGGGGPMMGGGGPMMGGGGPMGPGGPMGQGGPMMGGSPYGPPMGAGGGPLTMGSYGGF